MDQGCRSQRLGPECQLMWPRRQQGELSALLAWQWSWEDSCFSEASFIQTVTGEDAEKLCPNLGPLGRHSWGSGWTLRAAPRTCHSNPFWQPWTCAHHPQGIFSATGRTRKLPPNIMDLFFIQMKTNSIFSAQEERSILLSISTSVIRPRPQQSQSPLLQLETKALTTANTARVK